MQTGSDSINRKERQRQILKVRKSVLHSWHSALIKNKTPEIVQRKVEPCNDLPEWYRKLKEVKSEKEQDFLYNFYWPCIHSLPSFSPSSFSSVSHPAVLFHIFHYPYNLGPDLNLSTYSSYSLLNNISRGHFFSWTQMSQNLNTFRWLIEPGEKGYADYTVVLESFSQAMKNSIV